MGFITKLFMDASDTEFKLAQDLVAMAMADGTISDAERKMIEDICHEQDIATDTLSTYLQGTDSQADAERMKSRQDKMGYLRNLIRVMGTDGYSAHLEIYLLEIIAARMGLTHLEVVSLVLSTATRQYFQGDTGCRVLKSFLQNAIDPRGKSLSSNKENMRAMFDMMAQNVPPHQDKEDDKRAFVNAMDHATQLLLENSILMNEFKAMGIDFETVLMDEREQAIRRWL